MRLAVPGAATGGGRGDSEDSRSSLGASSKGWWGHERARWFRGDRRTLCQNRDDGQVDSAVIWDWASRGSSPEEPRDPTRYCWIALRHHSRTTSSIVVIRAYPVWIASRLFSIIDLKDFLLFCASVKVKGYDTLKGCGGEIVVFKEIGHDRFDGF